MHLSSSIIDNLNDNLGAVINEKLTQSEKVAIAVGYLFLSGLKEVYSNLKNLSEIKILIGNKTNLSTANTLNYLFTQNTYQTPAEIEKIKQENVFEYANDIGKEFRQTQQDKEFILGLYQLVKNGKLKIKIYTKGVLHAKAYIFTAPKDSLVPGQVIIGSSNFSKGGFYNNTELNVIVDGKENYEKMVNWFENLRNQSEEFSKEFLEIINNSWIKAEPTPYEVYMKVLYELVGKYIENKQMEGDWINHLFKFQIDAVLQAYNIVNKYGGVFVSDVVGLGKTYVGTVLMHILTSKSKTRGLCLVPPKLIKNWDDVARKFHANVEIKSIYDLEKIYQDNLYDSFQYVLVDESHKFKDKNSSRYAMLQEFIHRTNKKLILLSATPLNLNGWDIYNQIKLFHKGETTKLPIHPSNLKDFFKLYEKGQTNISDILAELMVRRTRLEVKNNYKEDLKKHSLSFPDREDPKVVKYTPSDEFYKLYIEIEEVLGKRLKLDSERDIYNRLKSKINLTNEEKKLLEKLEDIFSKIDNEGKFKYSIYMKTNYLKEEVFGIDDNGKKYIKDPDFQDLTGVGENLKELLKIMFYVRLESSPLAFIKTLDNIINYYEAFKKLLEKGKIIKTKHTKEIIQLSDFNEDELENYLLEKNKETYPIDKFNIEKYKKDLDYDLNLLKSLKKKADNLLKNEKTKLLELEKLIKENKDKKILVFTNFSDTAEYIVSNLKIDGLNIEKLTGSTENVLNVINRFSPKSQGYILNNNEKEIDILVATDVIAEGQNLQDANIVVNFDLHWNPVRLIQRIGRIDRIGSEHEKIFIYNFLLSNYGEKKVGLFSKIFERVNEIHKHIGEENKILTPQEKLNIKLLKEYEKLNKEKGSLDKMEELLEDNKVLTYSSLIKELSDLKNNNPELYEKIKKLPLRVQTAKLGEKKETLVFCKSGIYEYFYIMNEKEEIINSKSEFLSKIKCNINTKRQKLPANHDKKVTKIEDKFLQDIKQKQEELLSDNIDISNDIKGLIKNLRVYKNNFLDEYDEDLIDKIDEIIEKLENITEVYQKRKIREFKKKLKNPYKYLDNWSKIIIDEFYNVIVKNPSNEQKIVLDNLDDNYVVISEGII